MVKFCSYLLLSLIILACKSKSSTTNSDKKDTVAVQKLPEHIRGMRLTEEDLLSEDGSTILKGRYLTSKEMHALLITEIDSFAAPEFKYKIIDTIYAQGKTISLLIAREYVEDNMVWLVTYTGGKITQSMQVFNWNAEGSTGMEAIITHDTLRITDYNMYLDPETADYTYILKEEKYIPVGKVVARTTKNEEEIIPDER